MAMKPCSLVAALTCHKESHAYSKHHAFFAIYALWRCRPAIDFSAVSGARLSSCGPFIVFPFHSTHSHSTGEKRSLRQGRGKRWRGQMSPSSEISQPSLVTRLPSIRAASDHRVLVGGIPQLCSQLWRTCSRRYLQRAQGQFFSSPNSHNSHTPTLHLPASNDQEDSEPLPPSCHRVKQGNRPVAGGSQGKKH